MKGIERFQTALEGGQPDRIPVIVGNNNMFLCHFYDVTVHQLLDAPDLYADLTVRFVKEFEFDLIRPNVGYIFYGCGPELGVKWKFVESDFPGPINGCIENEEDLNQFKIPEEPAGYFKKLLDIHRILVKEVGDEVHVRGIPLGPFSTGCFLRGLQNFLLDSVLNVDFFRHVMKRCTELSRYFVEQISFTGVHDMVLNEVFLSPGYLSPGSFQKDVNPDIKSVLSRSSSKNLYFYQQDFMDVGNLPDGTSKKGLSSAIYYGTKEDAELLRESLKTPIPGHPPLVTVSGRSLVQSDVKDFLDFIRKGVDIILEQGAYNPCIYLVSVQASSKEEALEIAGKINRIQELRESL
ncbi:MAG: uroporphyrinogen decarboxylase family protein, partial [Desulfatiglandales bacterium]